MTELTTRSVLNKMRGYRVTQGYGAGSNLRVLPWERDSVRGILSARLSALSVARGAGKSAVIAAIGAAHFEHLVETGQRADVVCIASSFGQGKIIYDHAAAHLADKLQDRRAFRIRDTNTNSSFQHRATGAAFKCISSDPKRAHGLAPALLLCDEPGQWLDTRASAMWAALKTGLGKIPGSRAVALGTRPKDDTHFFSRLLDGGAGFIQSYTVDEEADPFNRHNWHRANPSLKYFPELRRVYEEEAAEARQDANELQSFKALRLNMGSSDVLEAWLLESSSWKRCESPKAKPEGKYLLGIDLGGSASLSGATSLHENGCLDSFGVFPERPSLAHRGQSDGVGDLYSRAARQGELYTAGEYVPDIGFLLSTAVERWGHPEAIIADRFREAELKQELGKADFPATPFITRGQGYRDGAEDVRRFRKMALTGKLVTRPSTLLRACIGSARVVGDQSANWKLSKKSEGGRDSRARDDLAAAAILVVAEAHRRQGGEVSGPTHRIAR